MQTRGRGQKHWRRHQNQGTKPTNRSQKRQQNAKGHQRGKGSNQQQPHDRSSGQQAHR